MRTRAECQYCTLTFDEDFYVVCNNMWELTAGPRGQFPRWRRSRKRLSVCSVLRCPDP